MDPNFLGHPSTSVFGGSEIPAVSFPEKPRSAMELLRDSLMDVDILMRFFSSGAILGNKNQETLVQQTNYKL